MVKHTLPQDILGRSHDIDERGWPSGTEKWEDRSGPTKHKVYAFNPPTHVNRTGSIEEKGQEAYHKSMGDYAPDSHTGRIGLGTYYNKLGMRKMDVDRRTRAQNLTGKDYLEVHAAYNASKK
jgi:hypothetical protein